MKGLFTLKKLSTDKIYEILDLAIEFKKGRIATFPDKKMAILFYENSTRTQYSFQMAMLKLGITPIVFNKNGSSVNKGESLYDTVRTFESLGVDGVVIRNSKNGFYRDLNSIQIPLFNAGDGTADHPTQTLLDLMTIYEEFAKFENLKVCIIGDVSHSRVAHGNAEIMKRLGMDVSISGPERFMDNTGKILSMDDAINSSDIIHLLRVQFERHGHDDEISQELYHKKWGMTAERVAHMKENAIIIHPAPVNRGMEIADEVVECEKSRIYKQMENGVYIRMAVIYMVLKGLL